MIASTLGSLPLVYYRRRPDGGRDRYPDHPNYRLLHDQPNPLMSSVCLRECLARHVLLWGNGFTEIERDHGGRPAALWPLHPSQVTPYLEGNRLRYRVLGVSSPAVILEAHDILHFRGLTHDGINGLSVIGYARESLGLTIAAERFGAAFFGNGATFGGVIAWPPGVQTTPQLRKEFREYLEKQHVGVERAHRFLALYEGAQYHPLGVPPEDSQFLQTRRFQIDEVARWFNLPPHKLKELSRSTYSNIESQSIEYVQDSIVPWCRRFESEINLKLVPALERNAQFAEFELSGLLRGDAAGRAAYYETMSKIGAMTVNEIRARENLNPVAGGDVPKGAQQ